MSRADYRHFTENAPDLPIFLEDWLLDAVCVGGSWSFVSVEKGEKTVAIWPFFIKKRGFWTYSAMPQLARLLGPYLLPELRGGGEEVRILKALLEKLPTDLAAFEQDFHYSIQNWLPFFWKGWRQTTRYSYRIDLKIGLEKALEKVDIDYRRRIRKGDEKLFLQTHFSTEKLFQTVQKSYSRQSLEAGFSVNFLLRLCSSLIKNKKGQAFFAVDELDEINAACLLIWDRKSSYLLLLGDDAKHRKNGATIWLIWQMIQFSKREIEVETFDFLGSMVEPIERVRRAFGAEQTAYFRMQKEWSPVFRLAKRLFR